jgi:hypothetical protein
MILKIKDKETARVLATELMQCVDRWEDQDNACIETYGPDEIVEVTTQPDVKILRAPYLMPETDVVSQMKKTVETLESLKANLSTDAR